MTSTFRKLTLLAQFDDLCRRVNEVIEKSQAEEDQSIRLVKSLEKRWQAREAEHERILRAAIAEREAKVSDKDAKIAQLERELKKSNRQLSESRAALAREADERKVLIKDKKALVERMNLVRQLVESNDKMGGNDLDRKRVIRCLDVDRLPPIQSDDDDSDDCDDLDYDKTEEDIMDPVRTRRSSNFRNVLESIPAEEQPTLLMRYLDENSDDDNHRHQTKVTSAESRRSSRRASGQATKSSASSAAQRVMAALDSKTDSNSMETDDTDIEAVRHELQKYEAEKREKLATINSTPSVKNHKAATLSSKSTASLMKTISNLTPSNPGVMKPHSFVKKKTFRPEPCGPCQVKIKFYSDLVKCETCGVTAHPECQDKCPLPCVKITAPTTSARAKKVFISDYVNSEANPKVPALIVHCCNEIERPNNIIVAGLYCVVARASEIEELQQKILKSKSGMPNLSTVDVHLLTGVVKRFLQGLDETLITTTLWSHLAEAVKLDSDVETRTHMSYYITYDLPTANRDTLAYLMQHFHAIAKHSDENNMTIQNLAKTLAPTIIGNSCRSPAPSVIQNESKIQRQIMESLFDIEEEFWAKFVQRQATTPRHASLGSRLLGGTPSASVQKIRGSSRLGATLPANTPKIKPLFSR